MILMYTFKEVCEDLHVSKYDVLGAVSKLDVPVLLKLPENAKLILTQHWLSRWFHPKHAEEIVLSDADYVYIPGKKLRTVKDNWPDVADCFNRFVGYDPESHGLSEVDWHQIFPNFNSQLLYQAHNVKRSLEPKLMHPWDSSLWIPQETLDAIEPELDDPLGGFKPREETANSIKDMNKAFQQFRIKNPLDNSNKNRDHVKHWLAERWNTPERKNFIKGSSQSVGKRQLEYATRLILDRDINVKIGNITIPQLVREQHHPQAPDWLILLEYLDQFQDQYRAHNRDQALKHKQKLESLKYEKNNIVARLKVEEKNREINLLNKRKIELEDQIFNTPRVPPKSDPTLEYELMFSKNKLLKKKLVDQKVGPVRYRDLIVRLLTLDAKNQNTTSRD